MFEMNRPQMYMAGLVVLLLGLEFRIVDSVVLNEQTTRFMAERFDSGELATTAPNWFAANMPLVKKSFTPPKWIGWSFLSIGGVMVLHSLVMRR